MKDKRCEAEIGRPGGRWHLCNRKAHYEAREKLHYYSGSLYYCEAHKGRIKDTVEPYNRELVPLKGL